MNTPKIDEYQFGLIVIDGRQYLKDVIVFPDRVVSDWWRISGHNLNLEDLKEVIKTPPEVLVIGCGYSSRMEIPEETIRRLESIGIEVRLHSTKEACDLYNKLRGVKNTAAALHLTC